MLRVNKKNKKIIMAIVGVIVAAWTTYQNNSNGGGDSSSPVLANSEVIYTKHAKCRMDCRYLDKAEVNDVLNNGKVNQRKSNPSASPCPVIAKEKKTKDNQLARVVYADCPSKIKIITVIDLDNKYSCTCD